MKTLLSFFVAIIIVTAILVFIYNMAARRSEGNRRGFHQAKMNISMGVMFLAIAGMHFATPGGAWLRTLLNTLILLIGLINLYYGIKHYRHFRTLLDRESETAEKATQNGSDPDINNETDPARE
ncbi:hypothetical protein JQC72_05505 [Polycladomyces sp. WAk]|uniref:YtpI-like protein n=1 Tax=Polycladomyces zharkentensis TaxID=2807616 RepID=A0ABS2WHH0_9BACL|nr:YtpI family protein [Polycladomyces sp. WAk]MBN2908979.1 hypothetical protein [Polycladomyces sp. WAk]